VIGNTFDANGSLVAVAAASDGSVAVAGSLKGSFTASGWPLSSTDPSYYDAYFAKYDASGNVAWALAATMNGPGANSAAPAIAVDRVSGDIVVLGDFSGQIILPTRSSSSGCQTLTAAGTRDLFLVKYSADGTQCRFAKNFAGGRLSAAKVRIDGAGNIYFAASGSGPPDFGGGALPPGFDDSFLVKLSPTGAHVWSKLVAGSSSRPDIIASLALDPGGNVVVSGEFASATLGVGGTTISGGVTSVDNTLLTNAGEGSEDIFIAKYSGADGHFMWGQRYGDSYDQLSGDIAIDSRGDIAVTGSAYGAINFGGATAITNGVGQIAFVARLTSSGGFEWQQGFNNTAGVGELIGATSIVFTSLDTIVAGGTMTGSGWLVELTPAGQQIWWRPYTSDGTTGVNSLAIDGGDNLLEVGIFEAQHFYYPVGATAPSGSLFDPTGSRQYSSSGYLLKVTR
jgi:hypothetical protein